MEDYWLLALDPRQAYVIRNHSPFPVLFSDVTCLYSGIREKRPLVRFFSVSFSRDLNQLPALPSSRTL